MRKYLNSEQENWLYINYSGMTNKDLAAELTKMVKEENSKEIKRLEGILPNMTDAKARKMVKQRIQSLKNVDCITEVYVKSAARRLGCPPKSLILVSNCSREKALIANIKRWEEKAVVVDAPMEWFNTFQQNETRICRVSGKKEVNRIRTTMSVWNRTEGTLKQLVLVSQYIEQANLLRVQSIINRFNN